MVGDEPPEPGRALEPVLAAAGPEMVVPIAVQEVCPYVFGHVIIYFPIDNYIKSA